MPASDADASRFLTQATFGPRRSDIALLNANGFTGWIEWQKILPISLQRPGLEALDVTGDVYQQHRVYSWWRNAVVGPDQLRQRMAFALSQIFVVSDVAGSLGNDPIGMAEYYDILTRNALGNYRELLEQVTLSPVMGRYLSMLGNEKADPVHNIRPDENYAREVMQLFTIGLYELNPDGTRQLDGSGDPIPTYDQADIENFARVFTGWTYADADSWHWPDENYRPMQPWLGYHDTGAKTLLNGLVLSSNQTPLEDLEAALDNLFLHQNVGPFISRLLIQRLVTSNPSPEYVGRVAEVFADDGTGERGDLFEVAKAILLDDEARNGHTNDPVNFGKLKEPLLRQTALWRAFQASSTLGTYQDGWPEGPWGQAPLRSPSVFNFYSPSYRPPGEMLDNGLFGPEFQITTHTLITSGTNRLHDLVLWLNDGNTSVDSDDVVIHTAYERSLANDPVALVDHLNLLLMGGQMSSWMHDVVVDRASHVSMADGGYDRVTEAVYLIVTSPEGAVQR
ncbi:MAG: DUF1800 domain-containing protein [Planctomycetota bacterium]|nr:DUF1800 domain-containing protein [Planctomycetota bacterium]